MLRTSIDTEAHWTESGWQGWVYGWKLHLVSVVAAAWALLAAGLTPAIVAGNEMAPGIIRELPRELRFLLDDRHYNAPNMWEACDSRGYLPVVSLYGGYPHTALRIEVGRGFHKLRSFLAIENFNEHFRGILDGHGQAPARGLDNIGCFALGAVFVYQMALLFRSQHGLELNIGINAFLKAA